MDLNLSTLAKHFSDEESAWALVEALRWADGPVCPHCGVLDDASYLAPRGGRRVTSTGKISYRRLWKCNSCKKQFSALVGTIFEDSKIPLSKWLLAIYLMCSGKNGVSALELSRQVGITPKSAWHMGHRIRLAMTREPMASKLSGIVEADETYVGGKKKTSGTRSERAQQRMDNKTPVVALVERGGEVRAQVMKQVTRNNIADAIRANVDMDNTTLMTDEAKVYVPVGRAMRLGHETVNHSEREYVRGRAYTNTVESFFGQLKRSIDGTHHHVGEDHLHRYVDQFAYMYNTRKMLDGQRMIDTIESVGGKRLPYRPLAAD